MGSPRQPVVDPGLSCSAIRDLAAAVALGAAGPNAAQPVEAHTAGCPTCAVAIRQLRKAIASRGSVSSQLDLPHGTRQPPVAAAPRKDSQQAELPRFRLFPRSASTRAWFAAAISLLLALGALLAANRQLTLLTQLQGDASAARDRAAQFDSIVQVLGSTQLEMRRLTPAVPGIGTTGMVYLDRSSGSGMLIVKDAPALPTGRVYQLWFVRGTVRVSGGLLWPDASGRGTTPITVPPDLASFESIGLTEEPSMGSTWPTSPTVLQATLGSP